MNEAMRWYLKAKAHGADVSYDVAKVMEMKRAQIALAQEEGTMKGKSDK